MTLNEVLSEIIGKWEDEMREPNLSYKDPDYRIAKIAYDEAAEEFKEFIREFMLDDDDN